MWSCGVVLYAMLCGFLPFEDNNTQSLYQKILKAEMALPSHLSNGALDFLSHIMVPDPDLRYGLK